MLKYLSALSILICFASQLRAQDPYVTSPGDYGQPSMYYQFSDNMLYAGNRRFLVTSTVDQSNLPRLFNGKYNETAITVPQGQAATITINLIGKNESYMQDSYGYIYLHFIDTYQPDSVRALVTNSIGSSETGLEWGSDWQNVTSTYGQMVLRARIPVWMQGLTQFSIRVKAKAGSVAKISEMELVQERSDQYEKGLFTKFGDNTSWFDMIWKDTSNTQKAFIKNTGVGYLQRLGIGTYSVSDSVKLAVEGTVKARIVKVDNDNWPDYVFDKKYKLPTLAATEAYIKTYHHLPGIASAADVKKNGVNLGETQAAMLQKIEELTLQVIEMQKQIKALKKGQTAKRK